MSVENESEPNLSEQQAGSDTIAEPTASPLLVRLTANGPFRPAPKFIGPVLVVCVVAVNLIGWFVGASAPRLLVKNPLLLMALQPRYRYMVVASPNVNFIPYFFIGLGRLLLSDPVYFLLGWFFGDRAISYFNNALGEQTVSSTRRFFLRAAPVMALFFAGPVICVLAGAAKMKPKVFFALNVIGTAIIVVLLRVLSDSLAGPIKSFLDFNKRYNKWLLIVSVVSTLIIIARVGTKQLKAAKNLSDDIRD